MLLAACLLVAYMLPSKVAQPHIALAQATPSKTHSYRLTATQITCREHADCTVRVPAQGAGQGGYSRWLPCAGSRTLPEVPAPAGAPSCGATERGRCDRPPSCAHVRAGPDAGLDGGAIVGTETRKSPAGGTARQPQSRLLPDAGLDGWRSDLGLDIWARSPLAGIRSLRDDA
jgi:hypothetical protein